MGDCRRNSWVRRGSHNKKQVGARKQEQGRSVSATAAGASTGPEGTRDPKGVAIGENWESVHRPCARRNALFGKSGIRCFELDGSGEVISACRRTFRAIWN